MYYSLHFTIMEINKRNLKEQKQFNSFLTQILKIVLQKYDICIIKINKI